MKLRLLILVMILMVGLLSSRQADATTKLMYTGHQDWQKAQAIDLNERMVVYGELQGMGDARFMAFEVKNPRSIELHMGSLLTRDQQFKPQVVVYLPDTLEAGPVLPFEQPPKTIGLVYSVDGGKRVTDATSKISYRELINTKVEVQKSGTVYVAVYNSDTGAGRFRLELAHQDSANPSLLGWPDEWWRAHTWAGISASTAWFPLGVLGMAVIILGAVKVRRRVMVKV